jgi:tetratricopeptide (TPR) repeat protein
MLLLILTLAAGPALERVPVPAAPMAQPQPDDAPDRLYADRVHLASAEHAAAFWEAQLARDRRNVDAAWKLARACYWMGGHVAREEQRRQYERGVEAGRSAVAVNPRRPEGHFWMAANMGALAESFGLRQGLKYRGAIKDALETVLAIDPAFQQGSADRALGRWYFKVPGLFGGSKQKSVDHLRRSLVYNPDSTASHYFLADTLLDMNRLSEARAELQKVLDAPLDPHWAPEDEEFKAKARARLATIE